MSYFGENKVKKIETIVNLLVYKNNFQCVLAESAKSL